MHNKCFLSIGSNVGNRLDNLALAIEHIKERCLKNLRYSIILETEAILPENAPPAWNKAFLNMIVSGQTDLPPIELLHRLKEIEKEMGRPKTYNKWAPRSIDLDILLYGEKIINSENLIVPHPE